MCLYVDMFILFYVCRYEIAIVRLRVQINLHVYVNMFVYLNVCMYVCM